MGKGWHPQDIMAAIRKRGSNLRQLGLGHGFTSTTMHACLTRRWPNAHLVIAQFLGVTRHEIWPQWYDRQDRPRFRTRRDARMRAPAAQLEQEAV